MKTRLYIVFIGVLLVAACQDSGSNSRAHSGNETADRETTSSLFQCPMHPDETSDRETDVCSICGMSLVAVDAPIAPQTSADAPSIYQCPMHPQFTSANPDENCPICGMALVPVEETSSLHQTVAVSSAMIQTMGVRTARAEVTSAQRSLRAFGTVETNERRVYVAVSRVEGWIDQLQPRAEGDSVQPGAKLYRVYSPALIAAQKDYLNSLAIGGDTRVAAVTQRLKSLGMQSAAIDSLKQRKRVIERVPVYAEAGGIVAKIDVSEGDYVKPGTPIMRLQSYESVWIIASIPERDLARIATGLAARLKFPSAPEAAIEGAINYIYPTIDANTRTGKVRIEVDNALGHLRPGAYADITFDLTDPPRLSIPTEAVLRDSRGSHVIVALGDGRFSSRTIETGISTGGLTEVSSGLEPGQRVVISAQFLLDSEVNLREGLSKLSAPGTPQEADPHAGHNHP